MATEQRDALRQLAPFLKRDNSKCAASTGFPIDGKVLRVDLVRGTIRLALVQCRSGAVARRTDLDQIGIPRISRDAKIIVALFLQLELEKGRSGRERGPRAAEYLLCRTPEDVAFSTVSKQLSNGDHQILPTIFRGTHETPRHGQDRGPIRGTRGNTREDLKESEGERERPKATDCSASNQGMRQLGPFGCFKRAEWSGRWRWLRVINWYLLGCFNNQEKKETLY